MSDRKGTSSPEAALKLCIDEMKKGALPKTFAPDVEEALRKHTLPNFKKYIAIWDSVGTKVVDASRAIGEIASRLAGLNGSTDIQYRHTRDAINAVKPNCSARVSTEHAKGSEAEKGPEVDRGRFCPDLP